MPTSPDYPGFPGFLGTRASFMLDLVFLAMFVVLPLMGYSIYAVKFRRLYAIHKRLQLALGTVLLITVAAFEIDMRLHGWEGLAKASPYFPSGVHAALCVHLCFAVTTSLLWICVIVRALRNFSNPPAPGGHGASHKFWAWIAALDMVMTAVTGWIFYGLAFIAR